MGVHHPTEERKKKLEEIVQNCKHTEAFFNKDRVKSEEYSNEKVSETLLLSFRS